MPVLPAGGFGNFEAGIVIHKGRGARAWDEDGKEYIDYLLGSGPMILGHCHPEITEAVAEQMSRGTTFFASNTAGIELAEEICRALPCAEQLRYVSSGSEADLYAIRLARAHTGRDKVLKFEGGYHGMSSESLMSIFASGSSNFPLAEPDSAGIPDSVRDAVMVSPFNDEALACELIAVHSDELACVIVEPFQRVLPPRPGFLEALRAETAKRGIILIFDEVVTGFRLAYGGAQERYGVVPDLCTVGKIVGGGFPLAAVAGRRALMDHFDRARVGLGGVCSANRHVERQSDSCSGRLENFGNPAPPGHVCSASRNRRKTHGGLVGLAVRRGGGSPRCRRCESFRCRVHRRRGARLSHHAAWRQSSKTRFQRGVTHTGDFENRHEILCKPSPDRAGL